MSRVLPALLAALLLTAALSLAACAKSETDDPAAKPPATKPDRTIAKPEAVRGHTACQTWADRACACAKTQPAVAATCAEAKKIPDALHMAVNTANSEGLDDDVRARVQFEARRIVARCIEETAKLPCR